MRRPVDCGGVVLVGCCRFWGGGRHHHKSVAETQDSELQDPAPRTHVACVCYACQAFCAVLSNDISILISLGVIVKCLSVLLAVGMGMGVGVGGAGWCLGEVTKYTMCHVDYGLIFGIYFSFYFFSTLKEIVFRNCETYLRSCLVFD